MIFAVKWPAITSLKFQSNQEYTLSNSFTAQFEPRYVNRTKMALPMIHFITPKCSPVLWRFFACKTSTQKSFLKSINVRELKLCSYVTFVFLHVCAKFKVHICSIWTKYMSWGTKKSPKITSRATLIKVVGREVHFLLCNAHFLLGLSHSCETATKHVKMKWRRTPAAVGQWQRSTFQSISLLRTCYCSPRQRIEQHHRTKGWWRWWEKWLLRWMGWILW